jgi:glycosyltransferase involved in cell wall biosynthesis
VLATSEREEARVRVALLVAPASFEGFYVAQLGLDRDRYVHEYRNDFVWNYTGVLREHGVDVITYVPSHEEDGLHRASDGFAVRFLRLPSVWRRLEIGFRVSRTPVERYALEAAEGRALLPSLRDGLEADGIDVLYVQEYWTGRFDVLARHSAIPVVGGEHGGSSGLNLHQFKRGALGRAAAITVQSTAEQRRLERYGCEAHLVTNGVDSTFFTPDAVVPRSTRILTVARLVDAQKRISDLIAAVAQLPEPWGLDLVGSGPDEQALRAAARRYDCADRVVFHGWVGSREELRALYRSCGVFALPSVWEAVTLAVLEAMACGAVPVVTPLRPFRDVIEDGVNGLFVPPRSPERLAAAVVAAYADRERLGAAARGTVEDRYDRAATIAKLASILRAAAASAPQGRR